MALAILDELQAELLRVTAAGSRVATADPRLSKYILPLMTLGEKAPVFAKLAASLQNVVGVTLTIDANKNATGNKAEDTIDSAASNKAEDTTDNATGNKAEDTIDSAASNKAEDTIDSAASNKAEGATECATESTTQDTSQEQTARNVLECCLLLQSILYTQSSSPDANDWTEPKYSNNPLPVYDIPYSQMKEYLRFLGGAKAGECEPLKIAYKKGEYADVRLYRYYAYGLKGKQTPTVKYLEQCILPALGEAVEPFLLDALSEARQSSDAVWATRLFGALYAIQGSELTELAYQILSDNDSDPVLIAAALEPLGDDLANAETLTAFARNKKAVIRAAALCALEKCGYPNLFELVSEEFGGRTAESLIPLLTTTTSPQLLEYFCKQIHGLLQDVKANIKRINPLLVALATRTDNQSLGFLRWVLLIEKDNALKSGFDIKNILATLEQSEDLAAHRLICEFTAKLDRYEEQWLKSLVRVASPADVYDLVSPQLGEKQISFALTRTYWYYYHHLNPPITFWDRRWAKTCLAMENKSSEVTLAAMFAYPDDDNLWETIAGKIIEYHKKGEPLIAFNRVFEKIAVMIMSKMPIGKKIYRILDKAKVNVLHIDNEVRRLIDARQNSQ